MDPVGAGSALGRAAAGQGVGGRLPRRAVPANQMARGEHAQGEVRGLLHRVARRLVTSTASRRLETAVEECSHLAQLAAEREVTDLSPAEPDVHAIEDLLCREEDIQLWHVAAHGRLDVQDPTQHSVVLRKGCWELDRPARPDLEPDRKGAAAGLLQRLPGCPPRARARQVGGLARPLARVQMRRVPGSPVVGGLRPRLDVLDRVLRRAGRTPGRSANVSRPEAARRAVRERAPHDPTWLAYAVYSGNPNAEVEFGK